MKLKDLFEDNVNGGSSSNSHFFKTYDETKNWLDKYGIEGYNIDSETLIVDVTTNNDVLITGYGRNLTGHIPVKFGEVRHVFNISGCHIDSLIGTPDSCAVLSCGRTKITSFTGLGIGVDTVNAYGCSELQSYSGLPNNMKVLNLTGVSLPIDSHFPKNIRSLVINEKFKDTNNIANNVDNISNIKISGDINEFHGILHLLKINGILNISSDNNIIDRILNSEIKRRQDPKRRNLLKVAQELSNAGFHHLTTM